MQQPLDSFRDLDESPKMGQSCDFSGKDLANFVIVGKSWPWVVLCGLK